MAFDVLTCLVAGSFVAFSEEHKVNFGEVLYMQLRDKGILEVLVANYRLLDSVKLVKANRYRLQTQVALLCLNQYLHN